MKGDWILRGIVGLLVLAAGLVAVPATLILWIMALPPWDPPWVRDKEVFLALGIATLLQMILAGWALWRLRTFRTWQLVGLGGDAAVLAVLIGGAVVAFFENPL